MGSPSDRRCAEWLGETVPGTGEFIVEGSHKGCPSMLSRMILLPHEGAGIRYSYNRHAGLDPASIRKILG